jgi:effector-binding domain-containing protein
MIGRSRMGIERIKKEKRIFASFESEAEWAEFSLRFNEGSKHSKPVKFQAEKRWSTSGCPVEFSMHRGSYGSASEAERRFFKEIEKQGATVHRETKSLVRRLEQKFGFGHA